MSKRTIIVDGDTLVYSASSSTEYEAEWDLWYWSLWGDFDAAVARFDEELNAIIDAMKADEAIIALSDEQRFRPEIMPEYKANRKGTRKPVHYKALRDYVKETRTVKQVPKLEGDDVVGLLLTHPKIIKGDKIAVAIDKDMKTLPGLHLNYSKALKSGDWEGEVVSISEAEADRFHLIQTLAGDSTDGYPGCPGVGLATAARLLDEGLVLEPVEKTISRGPRKGVVETSWQPAGPGTPWEVVVSAYRAAGLGEQEALRNARVARILRHTDFDFKTKEVRLWTP